MRKIIVAFFIFILVLTGCSNDPDEVQTKNTVEIQFEFHTTILEDSYDAPLTEVYLHIRDEEKDQKTKIGEYIGYFDKTTSDESGWKLPENSKGSYFGWYGGQGDILCIVIDNDKIIKVMHKSVEESGRDVVLQEEIKKADYKVIADFEVEKNSDFIIGEAIYIKD